MIEEKMINNSNKKVVDKKNHKHRPNLSADSQQTL